MKFKFFSENLLLQHHVQAIRKSRRRIFNYKYTDYAKNALDEIVHDKPMYFMPKDNEDWVLEELALIQIGENGSYNFNDLSYRFKKYLNSIDEQCYLKEYSDYVNFEKRNDVSNDYIDKVIQAVNDLENDFVEKGLEFTSEHREKFFAYYYANLDKRKKTLFENARRSAKRSYERVQALCFCNSDEFEHFITLTFAEKQNHEKYLSHNVVFEEYVENRYDYDLCVEAYKKFVNKLKKAIERKYKGVKFKYIAVPEEHMDGAFHFHILCSWIPEDFFIPVPDAYDYDKVTKEKRNGKMLKQWIYGLSDVDVIRDKSRVSTYIAKYIEKSLMIIEPTKYEEFRNRKKFYPSTTLKKPKEIRLYSGEAKDTALLSKVLSEREMYADCYEKKYNNPYSDSQIVKKVFTKRKSEKELL